MKARNKDDSGHVLLQKKLDVGILGDSPCRLRAQHWRVPVGGKCAFDILREDREYRIRQFGHDEPDSSAGVFPQLFRAFVSEQVERCENGLTRRRSNCFLAVENARDRCGRYPRLLSQI